MRYITIIIVLLLTVSVYAQELPTKTVIGRGYRCRQTGAIFTPAKINAHAQTLVTIIKKDTTIWLWGLERRVIDEDIDGNKEIVIYKTEKFDSSYVANSYYKETGTGKYFLTLRDFVNYRFEENNDQAMTVIDCEKAIPVLLERIKKLEKK